MMMSTRPTSDEINAAINTAARRMTAAAPSGDLRARVMTRIDARQARWGWRLAIAGGAIGAAAMASTPFWRTAVHAPVTTPAPLASVAAAASPESASTVWMAPASHVTVVIVVQPNNPPATTFVPSAAERDWQTRAVSQLPALTALSIDLMAQPALNIDPISIAPLVVPPLSADAAGSR